MSELDETLRRAAATTRAHVLHEIDIDNELSVTLERAASRLPSDGDAEPDRHRRRIVVPLAAAATLAFAVAGIGLLNSRSDSIQTSEPTDQTNAPLATGSAATTSPPPSTSITTTTPPTSSTPISPAVPSGMPATVSYLSPPPTLSLRSLGSVPVPPITDGAFDVAIGDLGIAVSTWMYGTESGIGYPLTVIGFDGIQRSIDLDRDLGSTLAFGPGDVLYSFDSTDNPLEHFAVVAVALDGERTGSIVASTDVSWLRYTELPRASFGHGRDGVVDRGRDVNATVIGYVDVDGKPVDWDGPEPPLLTTIESDGPEQPLSTTITQVPVDGSTERSWELTIDASPSRASSYVGPSPAAPTDDGLNVYWTHIGPNARPNTDFGEPTMRVIAALHPDGAVQWWSLPDGWEVVASDVWGTVLGKSTGNQLELALADFVPSPEPIELDPELVAPAAYFGVRFLADGPPYVAIDQFSPTGEPLGPFDAGVIGDLVLADGRVVRLAPGNGVECSNGAASITSNGGEVPLDSDLTSALSIVATDDGIVVAARDACPPGAVWGDPGTSWQLVRLDLRRPDNGVTVLLERTAEQLDRSIGMPIVSTVSADGRYIGLTERIHIEGQRWQLLDVESPDTPIEPPSSCDEPGDIVGPPRFVPGGVVLARSCADNSGHGSLVVDHVTLPDRALVWGTVVEAEGLLGSYSGTVNVSALLTDALWVIVTGGGYDQQSTSILIRGDRQRDITRPGYWTLGFDHRDVI